MDRQAHLGTRLLPLLPVQRQLLSLQRRQQISSRPFYLFAFLLAEWDLFTCEQIKGRQLLLAHVLADGALLLDRQFLRERDETLEVDLDVDTSGVIFGNKLLEPRLVVGACAIEAHHSPDSGRDGAAQLLGLTSAPAADVAATSHGAAVATARADAAIFAGRALVFLEKSRYTRPHIS